MKERFSEDDKAKILNISNENLRRLREESQSTSSAAIRSWVQQKPLSCRDTERCKFFNYTGFLKVEMFSDATECQLMKETMAELVRTEWDPERNDQLDSFGTDQAQNVARGDYFLDSCDKVHFFAEPAALVDGGSSPPFTNKETIRLQHSTRLDMDCTFDRDPFMNIAFRKKFVRW